MASRLSELSIKQSYDGGARGLPWQLPTQTELLAPVDFDKILESSDPRDAIQALAPQQLYFALKQRGREDCVDIMPLLSVDQWQRLVDYDAWRDDRLMPKTAFEWLNLYKASGERAMFSRYRSLDEEVQISLL